MNTTSSHFPSDSTGLPGAGPSALFELADGERFDLRIAPVAKRLGDATVRMLSYNGSIPGPTLRVRQGTRLLVHVVNEGDLEGTVHWHGLRVENRFDGTHETQPPIPIGGSFTYHLRFPDPGVYWYHPHIREDYGQELGLYGNIVVVPSEPDYWPAVHRELTLTLDDILIEHGKVAPFRRSEATHTAMGRFGNVLLANGEPGLPLAARCGEVVRLYVTNTANTREFHLGLTGGRMKLVGGDSGHVEREAIVESVLVAPSERVVVDVRFDAPGRAVLEHRTPKRTYPIAAIAVSAEPAGSLPSRFEDLRTQPDMVVVREWSRAYLDAAPDKTLTLVAEMDMGEPAPAPGAAGYVCPMHPEVVSDAAGRCPRCGMKLVAAAVAPASIEWEDDMVDVNRMTTPANMRWKLVDQATGAAGMAIAWRFRVGDRVKIRVVNTMDSDHPMHHPFHIHGAGRFLILSRDGVSEPNLVWKDTVLIPTGQTVDLLLDVTNPGRWMAHCHIAEHHESGMMFSFDVEP